MLPTITVLANLDWCATSLHGQRRRIFNTAGQRTTLSITSEPIAPPVASVAKRGRLSFMWLIPLVTLVVGGWFAWDTISKRGPIITITFEGGEGLQAGQSQVKHKDVRLGLVTSVVLSPDASHVVVTAQMNR